MHHLNILSELNILCEKKGGKSPPPLTGCAVVAVTDIQLMWQKTERIVTELCIMKLTIDNMYKLRRVQCTLGVSLCMSLICVCVCVCVDIVAGVAEGY